MRIAGILSRAGLSGVGLSRVGLSKVGLAFIQRSWALLPCVLLLAAPLLAGAQEASIQGIILDENSGQPVDGVRVSVQGADEPPRETQTDREGFYQIGAIPAGSYTLGASSLGYVTQESEIALQSSEQRTINLSLSPDPLQLDELVVRGLQSGAIRRELGRQRVRPADLALIPVPAGSGDVASYLQTLPGVVTTGDRGGQLFIRGEAPSQNMVLVDGLLIYQPFHILGFFSAFPEDLVSSVDFYAGGFGSRYGGRTSSVVDVQMREGNRNELSTSSSVSPFLADVLVEGPTGRGGSWILSARRSLIDETSSLLLGSRQPLDFESQFLKLSSSDDDTGSRCSLMAMRTADQGRLDVEQTDSNVSWGNLVFGGRCVMQFDRRIRLFEASFGYSRVRNAAISRGVGEMESHIRRMRHEGHSTSLIGDTPIYAGYTFGIEGMEYDMTELFGIQNDWGTVFSMSGYVEAEFRVGERGTIRPGTVLGLFPHFGFEPRVRGSWRPWGRQNEEVTAAVGLYRQNLTGINDIRDVGSVFTAWSPNPDGTDQRAVHAMLGWQQSIGEGLEWSLEGYYKWLRDVPVPVWRASAVFTTALGRADGRIYGGDIRLDYRRSRFYGFFGYGYVWTQYEAARDEFASWYGEPVQRYHPPHDRRHQINAMVSVDVAGFTAGVRWQLGSGLPYTQPVGFDEAFDFRYWFQNVANQLGSTRLILDRPFEGRLPSVHRLDVSLQRPFDLPFGRLEVQAGAMNAYDRRNMFYYDLSTDHRVDQLPLTPYVSLRMQTR